MQLPLVGHHADHRIRAAFARAHRLEERARIRRNRQHITLLRFIAPDFPRRHLPVRARRCISGLARWTESKSSAAQFAPAAIELAAPPPRPIRMPGPPIWINSAPAGRSAL